MKRKIVLSALMMGIVLSMYYSLAATLPSTRVPLEAGKFLYTVAMPWKSLRTPAAIDGTAFPDYTAINGCWSDICVDGTTIAATNGIVDLMEQSGAGWGGNGLQFALYSLDDAADTTFGLGVYGYADSLYGPAIPLYETSTTGCSVGTRICTTNPVTGVAMSSGLWVDTIGSSVYQSQFYVVNSGTNSICLGKGDLEGIRYIRFVVIKPTGTCTIGIVGRLW